MLVGESNDARYFERRTSMTEPRDIRPLAGAVAVVAGATRGAGRGI